jgi:Flp pilus assembly protein TadB
MKTDYYIPRRSGRPIHRKETRIFSGAAALLAFAVVYIYAKDPKLYFAIVAAAVMAGAIYFANYLQFHRENTRQIK